MRGFTTHEKSCRSRQEWMEEPIDVEAHGQGEEGNVID